LITFTVPGEAAPQGSKRAVRSRSGRILLLESSAKVKPYRAVFALAARQAWTEPPATGVVAVELLFSFVRPASHYTSKGILKATAPVSPRRPDLDKACRAALDAMTGVVYVDDSQVAILSACKEYGERAETLVKVWG
jgi:Holliday junction resolvase RusA-like endonuclease